ncbi:MAG: 1,4-dihydroxy-2-naphthoate octaprenyltransferase [Planctomycetota bacterium]|nr:1,4-dihydroxy-2-naphthoate octaprenyltransferase [Planctomycetota bacterium]MDA1106242.1 1,4-dihydroxy-2-naphthoate octaprenyltransferase [Planctomycetota bacterium]
MTDREQADSEDSADSAANPSARPTAAHAWLAAARPKTLGAVIGPCAIGAGLTLRTGRFDGTGLAVAVLGGVSIQLLTNLLNDLVDGVRGIDGPDRLGPARAVASGWLTPRAIGIACVGLAVVALACAFFLAHHRSLWFAPLALLSLALSLAYSAGPAPLSHTGAADPFALIFFGPVACAATVAAQTGSFQNDGWWLGLGPGGLALSLLAINNLRDVEGDARTGKRTLAVRLGKGFARAEVILGIAIAALVAIIATLNGMPFAALSSLVVLVLVGSAWRIVRGASGTALNRELHMVGGVALAYGVAMALAVALGGGAA